jgi:aspartyl-tRNA(Asn)/glutamyl-tRNA(Gln) amidotransferase subunit A
MPTLVQLAADLAAGRTTAEELVEDCLARIADPEGEGERACVHVDADGAREAARQLDALRRAGDEPSPFAGISVTVKDLFDVRGQVTRAGSRVLDGPPAECDATAVARWRQAGLVIIARTNMTEFAFSGLGLNPHHGTPLNPWDRARGRIPGGSSSGAAVTVTDGMAHGALGTDTGGSCRIPASLCGIVGFKPTQARIPRDGMVPLSQTLDAVGVLGRSVACCAVLEAILAGNEPGPPATLERPPRLAVPPNYLWTDVEPAVATAFERAARRLGEAGAQLVDVELPELDAIGELNAAGGFAAAESWRWHRELVGARADDYDPRVLVRIRRGEALGEHDLQLLRERRAAIIEGVRARLEGFDAFACPTVPIVAPPLDAFADDDEYTRLNLLALRNPTVVNVLDGCAISVPMHEPGEPPTGMMVAGMKEEDAKVLRIAAWMEERM